MPWHHRPEQPQHSNNTIQFNSESTSFTNYNCFCVACHSSVLSVGSLHCKHYVFPHQPETLARNHNKPHSTWPADHLNYNLSTIVQWPCMTPAHHHWIPVRAPAFDWNWNGTTSSSASLVHLITEEGGGRPANIQNSRAIWSVVLALPPSKPPPWTGSWQPQSVSLLVVAWHRAYTDKLQLIA